MRLAIYLLAMAAGLVAAEPSKLQSSKPAKKEYATNDPVYIEYVKLLLEDDAAEKEVDRWIEEAQKFKAAGDPTYEAALPGKAQQRFAKVKDRYDRFIEQHPDFVEARLAYGSFLMDIHEEEEGVVQWEKARELDPKNPAAWNNLANHYGHRGPAKKAFAYYQRAMELDPDEPVYPWNFATTMYLFRKDAREMYNIEEQEVFNRAMELYSKAQKLDPTNLVLATDLAQSYYGIKPMRTNDALQSWTNALALAKNSVEQQGIMMHLARVKTMAGFFNEARQHLNMVSNSEMAELKGRLERSLKDREAKATNATASASPASRD